MRMGRQNDKRPSSKPAAGLLEDGEVVLVPHDALELGHRHRAHDLGRLVCDVVARLENLGFGRIVASEIEAPNMLVNLL
jgi:hypothetical protein